MQYNIVTTNTLHRVFRIAAGNDAGTGFVVDVEQGRFLVTAKHLFKKMGYPASTNLCIQHENGWDKVLVNLFYHEKTDVDIAVVETNYFDGKVFGNVKCASSGMTISQEMFMLGFPYGLSTNQYDVNKGYPIPLVKKGIFSGVETKGNVKNHLIDWDNNHGFSGGPVVFRKLTKEGYSEEYFAGVINSYEPHLIKVYNEDGSESGLFTVENSGIGIMHNIKYMHEIIEKM